METEYKWNFPQDKCGLLHTAWIKEGITSQKIYHMAATYYDTKDKKIASMKGGFRIRQENESSICCLKLKEECLDGFQKRQEYEVDATTIEEGLQKLGSVGAPKELCAEILESEIVRICKTDYVREAYILTIEKGKKKFVAELALDAGKLLGKTESVDFAEMELEFKEGNEAEFHLYAKKLETEFQLKQEPLSKLARGMQLN